MNMKYKVFGLFFATALMFSAMASSAAAQTTSGTSAEASMSAMSSTGTIVDVAMGDTRFSTLVSLIKEAGLVETLQGAGPFTVFAPTNDAFAKVPAAKLAALKADPEMLKSVLLYHVIPGMKVAAADAKTMMAPTAGGAQLSVKAKMMGGKPSVMVDNAKVIQADVMASNGVIHAIDKVLMPKMDKSMMNKKTSSMK
jgi:uncharacterized surface protein with fasciclin (FAS1) repeats